MKGIVAIKRMIHNGKLYYKGDEIDVSEKDKKDFNTRVDFTEKVPTQKKKSDYKKKDETSEKEIDRLTEIE